MRACAKTQTHRKYALFVMVSLVVLATGSFVGSASASQTRAYAGLSFGRDGAGGTEVFQNVQGIAVDQGSGDVFVYDAGAGRVYKFDASGNPIPFKPSGPNFIEGVGGASSGENEIAVAPPNSPGGTGGDIYVAHSPGPVEIYSAEGVELGTVGEGETCGVAVDAAGHLFIGSYPDTIREYMPTMNPPTDADLSASVGPGAVQLCNVAADAGYIYSTSFDGTETARVRLADRSATRINPGGSTLTVDPGTDAFYVDYGDHISVYDSGGSYSYGLGAGNLTSSYGVGFGSQADRVYVGDGGAVRVFGPIVPVPTTNIAAASGITGTKAILNGAINPEGIVVKKCFFEWGETIGYGNIASCEGPVPPDSAPHAVHAEISGLVPDGAEYHFRLVAENENGTEHSADETLITAPTVVTGPATQLRAETATLNGTLRPEGRHYLSCRFEYGLDSAFGFEHEADCKPDATKFAADFSPHSVALPLVGLQPNTDFKFRLTAATSSGGEVHGQTVTFSTVGAPRITEVLSRADSGSATLEATIDPRADDTSYRIEWGATDSYGHLAATGSVPGAQGPTRVTAQLDGLAEASTYHYRIVAGNIEGGETSSPDQTVETLNSCGFTDGRCLELVSRADKGPLAGPGKKVALGAQIEFQAAVGGSALAYNVQSGYPETTAAAAAALYLGRRGTQGWASEQLTPPAAVPPINVAEGAENSGLRPLSPDLGCGAFTSNAPLTPDTPETVVAAGGSNLFLRNYATGAVDLITRLPPVNPSDDITASYVVIGMSPDCRRLVFRTHYRYPGIPSANANFQLYEWDQGTLRGLGLIPGGSGQPVPAGSVPGALDQLGLGVGNSEEAPDYWRAVSADGSRAIFTAVSQFGADSGQRAIFSRDANDPGVLAGTVAATDDSQSETATPNNGNSRYWIASNDGRRIFFTARYGLAANGSSSGAGTCLNAPNGGLSEGSGEGCDLYEYDADALGGAHLKDLSADDDDAKGAGVVGVLDASADGSYVYFAARGRLGGAGRSEAQNLEAGTYNIYLAHAGAVRYVQVLGDTEALGVATNGSNALVGTRISRWTSRATPDGTSLVFETSVGTPGGVPMVYLYSAAEGTSVCVSCRHDGRAPFTEHRLTPLVDALETNPYDRIYQPTILTENRRLYFYSFDPLAPGSVEGQRNLYQWEHGQLSLIASEPIGVPRQEGTPIASFFGGASADGGDVYFATPQSLVGGAEDGWNVYDARVDGGFPEPVPPAARCDAGIEGACNAGASNPPAPSAAATANFGGPANPATKKKHKHHRKKRHLNKHHKHRRHGDRRAGR